MVSQTELAPEGAAVSSEEITALVLAALEKPKEERLGTVMRSLIRHLHDFAREVKLQPEELLAGAAFLTACGKISDEARHEFVLLSDTLGLTMVVDTLAAAVPDGAFESSVLGPFYREGAPLYESGADVSHGADDGEPLFFAGRVVDLEGRPVAGANVEIWGTNAAGLYENVDPEQPDFNLRGRFVSGEDGRFDLWTVKPVSYPVPDDGPAGDLLRAMDRHNMRPAHLHVMVFAEGYRTIVSELFTDSDPYLDSDVVFGVKPSLVVSYERVDDEGMLVKAGKKEPFWSLSYDFVLAPGEADAVKFTTGRRDEGPAGQKGGKE